MPTKDGKKTKKTAKKVVEKTTKAKSSVKKAVLSVKSKAKKSVGKATKVKEKPKSSKTSKGKLVSVSAKEPKKTAKAASKITTKSTSKTKTGSKKAAKPKKTAPKPKVTKKEAIPTPRKPRLKDPVKPQKPKPTKRYSAKDLKEFDVLLLSKLNEAQSTLDFYLSQIRDIANNPDSKVKGLDDGTSTTQNENLYRLAARQRKHIQHLENARLRIKNNIYGVCRVTGILISKERLKAVPHATLSIAAKQRL